MFNKIMFSNTEFVHLFNSWLSDLFPTYHADRIWT